jgi:16S rRNA (uracil1498-N3)-methyltransferase
MARWCRANQSRFRAAKQYRGGSLAFRAVIKPLALDIYPQDARGIWQQRRLGSGQAAKKWPNLRHFGLKGGGNRISAMPTYDFRAPRLFVDAALAPGESVALERGQSNYLGNVLRLSAGDTVLAFNGRDGEWQASIGGRKRPENLTLVTQTRPQDHLPDLAYVFAPLKHARLDYMVQKAVEMGASCLQPVLTRFTQVSRINGERMRANVIEAAEQCGILSLADVNEPLALNQYLSQRDGQRLLVFCDEATEVTDPLHALRGGRAVSGGIDVLIGCEGGFAEEERAILLRQPRILRLSLGPRILRADTAAVAALALVQATLGDWTAADPPG